MWHTPPCNGNKAAPASHNVLNWVSNYATNAIIASIGLRVHGWRQNVCNANTARERGASITGWLGDLQHNRIGYACQNARRRYCFGQQAHRYTTYTGFKNRIENWNWLTARGFSLIASCAMQCFHRENVIIKIIKSYNYKYFWTCSPCATIDKRYAEIVFSSELIYISILHMCY